MSLDGLSTVNLELTDVCNKNCWMCGRRAREQKDPSLKRNYGFMDFSLVEKIAKQLPPNIVVQFHNNGEGLLYPRFGEAVALFSRQIKNIVTNGKLLLEKFDEIVDNLDTIAVSVFEGDPESEEQFALVRQFVERKGDRKPYLIIRCNGEVENIERYIGLGLRVARRALHSPAGSFDYVKAVPIMPEIGVCWDFLHHLAINRKGDVSICVRFDPKGLGILGNVEKESLSSIWNGDLRDTWLQEHLRGRRGNVPLCSYCDFWGVPTGKG